MTISFSEKNIYPLLDKASKEELDNYDFGIVKMDGHGIIKAYNKFECELAMNTEEEVLGKNFFTQIAPCTNNFLIADKYLKVKVSRDEVIDYVFTYRISPTRVKLRLLVEPSKEHQYLLVKYAA